MSLKTKYNCDLQDRECVGFEQCYKIGLEQVKVKSIKELYGNVDI